MQIPDWLVRDARRAKRILASEPGLAVAYLYGSSLKTKAYRDVDIALLYRVSVRNPAGERLQRLASRLDKIFGRETDLHIISELPDPLRFRIVKEGVRLLARDPLAAVRFESETLIRFLDFKPAYDALTQRVLERSAHG